MTTLAYGMAHHFALWERETVFWHSAMRRLYIRRTLDREYFDILAFRGSLALVI